MRPRHIIAVALAAAACVLIPLTQAHASPAAAATQCGGRYHQFTYGPAGILILEEHDISCPVVTKLGRALLRDGGPSGGHPKRYDGYTCRYVPIKAGGGAARCTRGASSVLFGFE